MRILIIYKLYIYKWITVHAFYIFFSFLPSTLLLFTFAFSASQPFGVPIYIDTLRTQRVSTPSVSLSTQRVPNSSVYLWISLLHWLNEFTACYRSSLLQGPIYSYIVSLLHFFMIQLNKIWFNYIYTYIVSLLHCCLVE